MYQVLGHFKMGQETQTEVRRHGCQEKQTRWIEGLRPSTGRTYAGQIGWEYTRLSGNWQVISVLVSPKHVSLKPQEMQSRETEHR